MSGISSKIISVIFAACAFGALYKYVPLAGGANKATWGFVLLMVIPTVFSLWKDIKILQGVTQELTDVYRKLFNIYVDHEAISADNETSNSDAENNVEFRMLSVDEVTAALEDSILYQDWMRVVGNRVNICTVHGNTYVKEDIHRFLNAERFIARLERHAWRQQLPQILTGAGILGTFFGLTLGLYRLNILSNGGELIQQMGMLISSSGTAFFTSLIGISFSLLYVITLIVLNRDIKREYNELVDALHLCIPYKSESEYLGDIITGSTQASQQLVTHVQGIEAAFTESMDKIVQNVGKTMGKMVSKQVKDLQEKVDSLNTTVTEMGVLTQAFSNAIGTYNETMKGQTESVVQFANSMKEEIQIANTKNLDATKGMLYSFEQHLVDTSNVFTNMDTLYGKFQNQMQAMAKNYTSAVEVQAGALKTAVSESVKEFNKAEQEFITTKSKYLQNCLHGQKETEQLIREQVVGQEGLGNELSTLIVNCKTLNDKLNVEVENIKKNMQSMNDTPKESKEMPQKAATPYSKVVDTSQQSNNLEEVFPHVEENNFFNSNQSVEPKKDEQGVDDSIDMERYKALMSDNPENYPLDESVFVDTSKEGFTNNSHVMSEVPPSNKDKQSKPVNDMDDLY